MQFSGGFVALDTVRIHIRRVRGDGPTLILLHGLTDNGACWSRVASQLVPEFDIVAVDARGHGLSDAPDSGYGATDHANDVMGVIESLGLIRVTLIGHSLGADTATQVAIQRPDLVAGLVLEDPPWSDDWSHGDFEARQHRARDWARRLEQLKIARLDEILALRRRETPHWVDDELLPWAQSKLEVSISALDYIVAERPAWQLVVRRLPCRTLLVRGETSRGGLVSEAMADEARNLSSELEVLHLEGAGHSVHRDQFEGYMAGLLRFLA